MAIGGGDVGGASFSIVGDASQLEKVLADVRKLAEQTAQDVSKSFEKAGASASGLAKIRSDLAGISSEATKGAPAFEGLTKKVSALSEATDEVIVGAREYQKELDAIGERGAENVKKVEKAIGRASDSLKQASKVETPFANPKLIRGITFQVDDKGQVEKTARNLRTVVNELTKVEQEALRAEKTLGEAFAQPLLKELKNDAAELHAVVGSTFTGFRRLEQNAVQPLNRIAQVAQGAFNKAAAVLGRFGLNVRDVGIILGSGLLSGGIALIARELLRFVAATLRAIFQLGVLGGAFLKLEAQVRDTFQSASQQISDFSREFSSNLGISETAALTFIGRMGQLFQAQGEGVQASAELSEGLLVAADVLRRTTIGAGTYEEALRAVQNTIAGNIEGLREYNIFITENDLRQQAVARGIEVTKGALDAETRQRLAALEVIDQTQARLAQLDEAQGSLTTTLEKSRSIWTDLKTTIGQAFAPVLGVVAKAFNEVVGGLLGMFRDIGDAIKQSENFRAVLKLLANQITGAFQVAFKILGGLFRGIGQIIAFAIRVLDKFYGVLRKVAAPILFLVDKVMGAARAIGILGDASEETKNSLNELQEAENQAEASARAAAEAHKFTAEGLKETRDGLQEVVDARKALIEAEEEGARNVARAEEDVRRAIEDTTNALEDAQRRVDRAQRDRVRAIADATRKITEVEEQNARAIADAQDKLSDAQTDQFRSIRNAEEKLRDARVNAAKKVNAAEKALHDARRRRAQQILDAQLGLEAALRRGDLEAENAARRAIGRARQDDSVKDAQRARDDAAIEGRKDIAEAERDLLETRLDAAEKVAEAQEDLARTFADAARRSKDAQRDLERTLIDSAEKVADAKRDQARAIVEAERRMEDAIQRRDDAERNATKAIEKARNAAAKVNDEFDAWDKSLKDVIDDLEFIKDLLEGTAFTGGGGGSPSGSGASGGFAHGGLAPAGQIAVVGERGPELIIPNSNSTVIPNDQLIAALSHLMGIRASREGGNTIIVNEVANDPQATAFAVSARLARMVRN